MKKISKKIQYKNNPRKIKPSKIRILSKTVSQFGDLSGIVLNRRNGQLVSGNQRSKILENCEIKIEKKYKTPTSTGTVSVGYVLHHDEVFSFREVDWDDETHAAAAIAANKGAGEWDFPTLKNLMGELDSGAFDFELTGFEIPEIENFLTEVKLPPEPLSEAEKREKAKDEAKSPEENKSSHEGSQRVTFSLAMDPEDKKQLMETLDEIKLRYECEDYDEALMILLTFFS